MSAQILAFPAKTTTRVIPIRKLASADEVMRFLDVTSAEWLALPPNDRYDLLALMTEARDG